MNPTNPAGEKCYAEFTFHHPKGEPIDVGVAKGLIHLFEHQYNDGLTFYWGGANVPGVTCQQYEAAQDQWGVTVTLEDGRRVGMHPIGNAWKASFTEEPPTECLELLLAGSLRHSFAATH